MAELRKIVPRPALSDFRQPVNPGPNTFDILSGLAEQAYTFLAPAAVEEMKRRGTAEGLGAAQGGVRYAPAQGATASTDPNSPQGIAGDAMAALGKGKGHDHASHPGQTHEAWLKYSNQSAVRNDPLSPRLVEAMSFVGGMGITMDVVSGGQESNRPGEGKGSTRHNHGNSADVDFYKDGRKLDWNNAADLPILQEIVRTAKSRGVTGIGAGDDYMGAGRFHVGFGAPAVWGAGGKSANAPAWLVEAYNGAPAGASQPVTAPTSGGQPGAMVRTTAGKVEPRLFSPLSGPILQAHNAAAGVAYISEKMVQGQTDLVSMAGEFALNPQGFQQAAEAYIGQMVDDAPEQFRTDLMMEMRGQAQKTFLGIVEDQQRDTRQRAANASSALADRWAGDYADALASGDMKAAGEAEAKLRSVLRTRETLPGIAWTPEQSENVVLEARRAAEKAVATRQKETETSLKGTFKTIIDAAKAGLTAADESILSDPTAREMLPDLWREASAFVTLRDQIPTFNTMTPEAQRAALAEMKAQPVTEDWEVDLYGAAEKVAAANATAWRADPIKRAGEVLQDEPPPPIPELDPNNPEAFMAALGERAVYANRLTEAGYVDRKVYVSKDEAKALGGMFAKEVPPELKAMAAGAIVGAMGEDAEGFFKQIKTNDPVIPHVGALMARGGDTTVAVEAMTGQMYLDDKTVPAPAAKAVQAGKAPLEAALRSVPGIEGGMNGITKVATAIYAARVPANADEETQASVMQEAWQAALGQSDDLGILRGGVQEVGGQQVLLPPTVAGEDLNSAMEAAFGFKDAEGWGSTVANAFAGPQSKGIDADLWMQAAGGIPALGGEPIGPDLWSRGEITMTPVGGSKYMLSVTRNGVVIDIGVQGQADDVPFIFDAEALIGASMVQK